MPTPQSQIEAAVSTICSCLVSGLSMFIGRSTVAAAAYSNASVAGTFVCVGSGYGSVKDQKGAASWVPTSFVGWYTLDGRGKLSSIKETDNTAGIVGNYTANEGAS